MDNIKTENRDGILVITGKRGEKGKETIQFIKGAPDRANSKVPYYEVFGNYAPAAENAMR